MYGMWGGWGAPAAKPMSNYCIHIVKGGKTLCGILTCELKAKDRWVERDGSEAGLCSCEGCEEAFEIRKLWLAGKPIPKKPPTKQR